MSTEPTEETQPANPEKVILRTVRGYLQQAVDDEAAVDPSALIVLIDQLDREQYSTSTERLDAVRNVSGDAAEYLRAYNDGNTPEQTRILASYGPIVGTDVERLINAFVTHAFG